MHMHSMHAKSKLKSTYAIFVSITHYRIFVTVNKDVEEM